ncbi:hypothetical protein [Streptomyces sp. NPDC046942]|uniref:hypothetical protein n=1 Tax=Streptomyces sp. NPDC046942 TaxID=3155137 RepID=UPI00340E6205
MIPHATDHPTARPDTATAAAAPHRHRDPGPAWRRRVPARALLVSAPVLFLAVVTVTDLLTPGWLHIAPVLAAVPVLAAALLPWWATAALACATLVITALLQWAAGSCGRPDADVTLAGLFVVGLTSPAACALRQRRERQLRQVRSVAETAQRALMHPLPPPRRLARPVRDVSAGRVGGADRRRLLRGAAHTVRRPDPDR